MFELLLNSILYYKVNKTQGKDVSWESCQSKDILVHYLSQTIKDGTVNIRFPMYTRKHKYRVFSNLHFRLSFFLKADQISSCVSTRSESICSSDGFKVWQLPGGRICDDAPLCIYDAAEGALWF